MTLAATEAVTFTIGSQSPSTPTKFGISGSSISLLTVTDADGDALTITVAAGDDASNKFTFNSGNPKLIETSSNAIDYETLSGANYKYTLVVEATDGTNTGTATVIVTVTNVNEATPSFVTASFSPAYTSATTAYNIDETSAVGTSIVTVTASDADIGAAGEVEYSVGTITKSTGSATTGIFGVDPSSGVLSTIVTTLDCDTATGGLAYYDVTIIASDKGSPVNSATIQVRVGLVDVNDNTPTFAQNVYTVSIPETTAATTSLLTLTATDDDVTAAALTFTLETSSSPSAYASKFELDSTTTNQLNLLAAVDLDVGDASSYILVVSVADGGSPALTSTTSVIVTVTAVNDAAPSVTGATVAIDESTAVGGAVITVAATDADTGADGDLTFSISLGNSAGKFAIDPTTAAISVAGSLDYETTTQYLLTVKATDGGSTAQTGSATITVNINDISDQAPTCSTNSYQISIDEPGTVSSVNYVSLACTDTDAVDTLTYSIASGNTGTAFSISASGEITLASALDYDAGTQNFVLSVQVTDGTNTLTIPVTVDVNHVNEAAPSVTGNTVSYVSLACTDTDAVDTLTYSIASGNTGTTFSISASGEITLASALDYDAGTQNFALSVQVTDGTNTLTMPVAVDVNHVNEAAPSVTGNTVSIDESTVVGGAVTTVAATDADAGNDGDLTYSIILGNSAGKFDIDPTTGAIRVTGSLDYETTTQYLLTVQATDGGSPAQSGSATVTVNINDISDQAPTCSTNSYQISIDEPGTVSSVNYVSLACTDTDAVDTLTYSIASGNTGTTFSISASGEITLASALDYDAGTQNFALSVQVTDGTNTLTMPVAVDVNHVNEAAPSVTGNTVSIDESTVVGGAVTTVAATDADAGNDGDLTYSIILGNSAGKFDIDPTTGAIRVTGSLDYETTTQYLLTVQATDGGSPAQSGSATVTVNINDISDQAPTCSTNSYQISIDEPGTVSSVNYVSLACTDTDAVDTLTYSIASGNTGTTFSISASGEITLASGNTVSIDESTVVGGAVTTVAATDADAGNDGDLTYSIILGNSAGKFDIDPTTGAIRVTGSLDYETTTQYLLTVQATDGGSPAQTGSATVTYVSLACTDTDAVDTLTYSIASGNTGSKFNISPAGVITLASALDYDAGTQNFAVSVQVTDGTTTLTIPVTIVVNPVNEATPTFGADVDVTFAENTAVVSNSGSSKFSIDHKTGELSLAQMLDYETATNYVITVLAVDGGSPTPNTGTGTVTIQVSDVNDNVPTCSAYAHVLTVAEDTATTTAVISDLGCTDGDGTTPTYSIATQTPMNHFSIDTTGATPALVVGSALDFETNTAYNIEITVSDGSLSTIVHVDIEITDVNDGGPTFALATYSWTLSEDENIGASLLTVTATDPDLSTSEFGRLTFSITAGNSEKKFIINPQTGKVSLAGPLDYDSTTSYSLTLQVSEESGGNTDTATLDITVTNENDNIPSCTSEMTYTKVIAEEGTVNDVMYTMTCSDIDGDTLTYTIGSASGTTLSIAETEAVGTSVYQAAATDAETGGHGELRYYIGGGNTGDAFSIDPITGNMYVAQKLDYDAGTTSYSLTIKVEDMESSGTDTRTSSITLVVTITDDNDQTPIFTQNLYTANLDENVANPTTVLTVAATETDTGASGTITYSIKSGTGTSRFTIDETTGVISTNADIDFEVLSSYDLIVEAKDSGASPLSSTCYVRITIIDMNDNTPVFPGENIAVSISEATAPDTEVTVALATDSDSVYGNNNVIVYSFSTVQAKFKIHQNTGSITVKDTLDRETATSHTFIVFATDQGTNPQANTGSVTYTVYMDDENDNDPVVQSTPYDKTVAEDTPINTVVYTLTVTDNDENENAHLTYEITNGNTNSDFYIDSASGLIQFVNVLDRETTDLYKLEVTITDSGSAPRSTSVTATVTISDVNDNNPIFQPGGTDTYNFSISEHQPAATLVDLVDTTDADIDANGAVTYQIAYWIDGNSTHFDLDSSSGAITTEFNLDRETFDLYTFVARATDGGTNPLTATATVTIHILDYNDNKPTFTSILYTGTVIENTATGTSILTLVIDDIDILVNDDITLSITNDATADFYLATADDTFIISVETPIDRETIDYFNFTLTATDGGSPALSFTTSIEITVLDVNDNEPLFSPTFYSKEIAYNDGCQLTAATLTASDADIGVNKDFTFSVTQNDNPELFELNSVTGDITLIATAYPGTKYEFYASATDEGSPALTSTQGATVRIDAYNPDAVVLNYYMSISRATFLTMESTFFTLLTTVFQQTYSTSEVKRWCVAEISSSSCIVRSYVIKDNTADEFSELGNDKVFLSVDEAYTIAALDDVGTPAGDITGPSWTTFGIYKVEKYVTPEVEISWIRTTAGIVTVSLACGGAFILLLAGTAVAVYKYRHRKRTPISRAEETENRVDRRKPARRPKEKPMFQASPSEGLVKPYDKANLPPAIVALPLPNSQPQTARTRGPAPRPPRQREMKLHSANSDWDEPPQFTHGRLNHESPHPVPKPPVYEPPASPSRALLYTPPRNQITPVEIHIDTPPPSVTPPPIRKPDLVNTRNLPLQTDIKQPTPFIDDAPSFKTPPAKEPFIDKNYVVTNRKFDGRAIDPVSGRMFEFNTKTNERRFLTPEPKN
ncbi:FAT4-like protein [Mya arenaria]|uniref:FAT4-like protein n=1 Tax=Mya arenaria TaxID=6604 RepID=A0ABY7FXI8_MYAAR|nr:FAT4-like protein [Mya arenaria]